MSIQSARSFSRRSAVAGLGASGLGLALATRSGTATAQDGAGDLAGHPLVGTWLAMTGGGIVPQYHGADGSIVAYFPPNYVDPALGLTFQGPALGQWEPVGARGARLTFIQALSDPDGAYVGTFQVSGEIEASEDGQAWASSASSRIIVRDAANNVTVDQTAPNDPPVTATRIGATAESVVLPVATPAAATPTG